MSVYTRGAGTGWSSISNPNTYGTVVGNYADYLGQVVQQQEQTELDRKIFDYQEGNISFDELNTFLDTRMEGVATGSAKELSLLEIRSSLNEFERQRKIRIKRANLQAKFAKDGISAAEALEIEQELLNEYKEGTPEYAEQQAIVEEAKQVSIQDEKNRRFLKLQSELSEDGLTSEEQLEVLEEMADLADKDSEEFFELREQANLLENRIEQEQQAEALLKRESELLDQYASGGITTEEALIINRELQSFFEPGTEEYNDLKRQEASLEESAARGSGSGGSADFDEQGNFIGDRGVKQDVAALINRINIDNDEIERAFRSGEITAEEYLQRKNESIRNYEQLNESLTDQEILSLNQSDQQRLSQAAADRNALNEDISGLTSGNTLTIVEEDGTQRIIDNTAQSILTNSSQGKIAQLDENGNIVVDGDRTVEQDTNIIRVLDKDGEVRQYQVGGDGTLELVQEDATVGTLVPSGVIRDSQVGAPFVREERVSTEADIRESRGERTQEEQQVDNRSDAQRYLDSLAAQGKTPENSKEAAKISKQISEGRTAAPGGTEFDTSGRGIDSDPVFGTPVTSSSVRSSTENRPSGFGDIKPGRSTFAPIDFGVSEGIGNLISTPGKVEGTRDFGVTEALGSVGIKSTPGKRNISTPLGNVNLPEFGVTEAVGSAAKKAKDKLKSAGNRIKSFFGR